MRDKVKITRAVLKRLGAYPRATKYLRRPVTIHVDPEKNIRAAEALMNHPVYLGPFRDAVWLCIHTLPQEVEVSGASELLSSDYERNDLYVIAQVLAMAADNLTAPKRRRGA